MGKVWSIATPTVYLYHGVAAPLRARPKAWEVQVRWQRTGNRSHGIGWDDDKLWVAAFFRHDRKTGNVVEKIQLSEKDPVIHGNGPRWLPVVL